MSQHLPAHRLPQTRTALTATLTATLMMAVLAVAGWLRGDGVTDDRGSDGTEKTFMIILAGTLGTAVSVAAIAYIATKIALFK